MTISPSYPNKSASAGSDTGDLPSQLNDRRIAVPGRQRYSENNLTLTAAA